MHTEMAGGAQQEPRPVDPDVIKVIHEGPTGFPVESAAQIGLAHIQKSSRFRQRDLLKAVEPLIKEVMRVARQFEGVQPGSQFPKAFGIGGDGLLQQHGAFRVILHQAAGARSAAGGGCFFDRVRLSGRRRMNRLNASPYSAVEKQGMIIAGLNNLHSCGPVFDGVNFDGDDALAIIESGKANYVDILGGFNRDEFHYYYDFCDMKKMDDTTLVNLFGKYAHYAKRTLERQVPEGDDRKMIDVVSKYLYGNATIQLFDAYAKAGRGNRLYLYRLDWDKMPMRAHHGIDSAFVMGDDKEWPGVETYEGFEELSATILGAWKTFIKDAYPQAPGMPEWPVYTADDKRLMRFDTTVEVLSLIHI